MTLMGKQPSGHWSLSKDVMINDQGVLVAEEDTPYAWISSLLPRVNEISLNIPLPLNTNCISQLIKQLEVVMQHNIYPCVLLLGAAAMSLHYETILSKYQNCPIPLAFGPSGTGKQPH